MYTIETLFFFCEIKDQGQRGWMGVAGGGQIHLQRSRSNLTYAPRGIGLHLKVFLWKNKGLFFFLAFYVERGKECRNFIFSIFVRKKMLCNMCWCCTCVIFLIIYWTRNELMSYTLYIFMNKFFRILLTEYFVV